MNLNRTFIPVGALVIALGASGMSAEAAQRDSRGRDRNGRESQGQARERDGGRRDGGAEQGRVERPQADANPGTRQNDSRGADQNRSARDNDSRRADQDRSARENSARPRYESRQPERQVVPDRRDYGRNDRRDAYRYDGYRNDGYRNDGYRSDGYRYYGTPRIIRPAPRHYYGPGGRLSVYFGLGSGYLYGSPYSGRVYGYVAPRSYGARIYYGDIRLQVQPRDAAVYVDGYYAGIVDDFDGVFQRLTLEVGPHQIELEAPGLEPQTFDIYVDPARTVNIRSDLFR
jgi:hypothetical protein